MVSRVSRQRVGLGACPSPLRQSSVRPAGNEKCMLESTSGPHTVRCSSTAPLLSLLCSCDCTLPILSKSLDVCPSESISVPRLMCHCQWIHILRTGNSRPSGRAHMSQTHWYQQRPGASSAQPAQASYSWSTCGSKSMDDTRHSVPCFGSFLRKSSVPRPGFVYGSSLDPGQCSPASMQSEAFVIRRLRTCSGQEADHGKRMHLGPCKAWEQTVLCTQQSHARLPIYWQYCI